MLGIDPIRAWKDEEYRLSLAIHERAMLPENPAGEIEVRDEELEQFTWTLATVTGSSGTSCPPHDP